MKLLVNRHLPKRDFFFFYRKAQRKLVASFPPLSCSTSSLQHWCLQLLKQLWFSVKLQMKSRSRWLQAGTCLPARSPTQGSHIHHQVPACGPLQHQTVECGIQIKGWKLLCLWDFRSSTQPGMHFILYLCPPLRHTSAHWPQEGSDSSAGRDNDKWFTGVWSGQGWLAGWEWPFPSAVSLSLSLTLANVFHTFLRMVDPLRALCC